MSGLIRLYPRRWRERYGAELEDLVARRPPTVRDRLDLVRGAFDAWLHPELVPAAGGSAAVGADRSVGARPALAAVAAMLGGALAIAGSLLMNDAPLGPFGYREEPAVLALIFLAILVTAVAALAAARPAQVGPARAMVGLASLSLFGWPLFMVGTWGYIVAAVAFAVKGRDRVASILVGFAAILLPLMNFEDARILFLVPFGLAWIVVGFLGLRTASLVGAPE